jgi:hypothetical protein
MAIQEISQQNITNDDLEKIKNEINEAIEIGQKESEILLAQQIAQEADARQAADKKEAAAREKVAIQADENRFALDSLLQLILAKLGPPDSIALITESRDIFITEAGTRLVA